MGPLGRRPPRWRRRALAEGLTILRGRSRPHHHPPRAAGRSGANLAHRHNTTLEDLVRQLLDRELAADSAAWVDALFARMDEAGGDSRGATWSRDDL